MTETEPGPPPAVERPGPLEATAIVLAASAALLLLGGVLFAFGRADAGGADATARFRLLGQAANPFTALLALGAVAVVIHQRRRGGAAQIASGVALGLATAVSLALALLTLNGVLTDLTADATWLLKLGAFVNRLGAIVLSGLALWLAATATPPRR